MANARVQRGRQTEELAAQWFREHGWTGAERRPASLPGTDLLGTGSLAVEVKARRDLDLTGWLKQAASREGLPLLVVRPDGYGPERIAQWPVVMTLKDATDVLHCYEFGDAATAERDRLSLLNDQRLAEASRRGEFYPHSIVADLLRAET